MSWKLFSTHCRGKRQERMYGLLRLMEANERSNRATTPADFASELGLSRPSYRVFYAAEREGFARRVLVPNGYRKDMAYVLREKGREWLEAHRDYLGSLSLPKDDPPPRRKGGARPCQNMAPLSQMALKASARRKASLERLGARRSK